MLQSIKIGKSEIKRVEHTDLQGRKRVVFADQDPAGFKIICSPAGMDIMGMVIVKHAQLQDFAKLVGAAWQEAERLKPKIATSTSSLPDPAV